MYRRIFFFTSPSDKRFVFKSGRLRSDVLPVPRASATPPAARALEQAAVQALPGCRQGRRPRWQKKRTKRAASSRERAAERGASTPSTARFWICYICWWKLIGQRLLKKDIVQNDRPTIVEKTQMSKTYRPTIVKRYRWVLIGQRSIVNRYR